MTTSATNTKHTAPAAASPPNGSDATSSKPNFRLLWRHGWQYLRMFPKYVALLVALSLTQSVVMVSTPLLLGKITSSIKMAGESAVVPNAALAQTDKVQAASDSQPRIAPTPAAAPASRANSRSLIGSYVLWLLCAFGGIGLAFGLRYCQAALDVRMANAIRERLYSRILRQPPEFYHANDPGRLTMIVNQMSIDAQIAFKQVVLDPFFQAFTFLLGATGLLYSFAQLQQGGSSQILWIGVAVVLLLALLSPLAVGKLGNRLQASSADVVEQNIAIASLVNGSLKSPEEVQAFNAEEYFVQKHRAVLEKVQRSRIRQTLTVEAVNTFNSVPTVLIQVLFIGVAVAMVLTQPTPATQAGYLISILLLVPQIMGPIQGISCYLVLLRSSWPSVETVLQHLSEPDRPSVATSPSPNGKPAATLEAKNLVFRYRPDLPPVFDNLSFTVPTGKITGLVARMGQGKTTFFRLALGFYQPEKGQIIIGGRPATDYTLPQLRQHAGMMSQFPAFFHDNLRDNLRVAEPAASDEDMQGMCKQTGIWSLLQQKVGKEDERRKWPDPLDRPFGGGQMLSGGQKKLLALTRCLLRSPSFLFLDEPTVGMDNLEKFGLVESLRNACKDKTVLVVDHDIPWLIRFCDSFLVLENGKLVQSGQAKELLATPGLFKELYEKAMP